VDPLLGSGTETAYWKSMGYPIIILIIGATGIVTKSLRKNLQAIPGKHSTDSLQQTAILGTSHIIRKVLQPERWGSPLVQGECREESL
jgi:hypothetical protein